MPCHAVTSSSSAPIMIAAILIMGFRCDGSDLLEVIVAAAAPRDLASWNRLGGGAKRSAGSRAANREAAEVHQLLALGHHCDEELSRQLGSNQELPPLSMPSTMNSLRVGTSAASIDGRC